MTPTSLLDDVTDALWEFVKAGRPLPVDLATALHDALGDLREAYAGLESYWLARHVLDGQDAALPPLEGLRARRAAAWEQDGNVVRLPVAHRPFRPSHLSGCFRVEDGVAS